MIFPGNKIPDWFSHRKENSSSNICEIDINEPSNVDGEIIRMALCAVIGLKDAKVPSRIFCSVKTSSVMVYQYMEMIKHFIYPTQIMFGCITMFQNTMS